MVQFLDFGFQVSAEGGSAQPPEKKTAGLIKIETAQFWRRVGHRADQYRRARWPALRSQIFVFHKSAASGQKNGQSDRKKTMKKRISNIE
jgi:hypothetical protein